MSFEGPLQPGNSQEDETKTMDQKFQSAIKELEDKSVTIGNISILSQEVLSLMKNLLDRTPSNESASEGASLEDEIKYYINELWQSRILKEDEAKFYAKSLANITEDNYAMHFFAILKLLSESDLFAKGEQIDKEAREQLEKFDTELEDNILSIAGFTEAEFVEQNAEVFGEGEDGEAIASQMYHEMEYPLRGFDSWAETRSDKMLEIFQDKVMQGAVSVDKFINSEGEEVEVFKTEDNMHVLKITSENGYMDWILKPIESEIQK